MAAISTHPADIPTRGGDWFARCARSISTRTALIFVVSH
jgi:hypothetical protein